MIMLFQLLQLETRKWKEYLLKVKNVAYLFFNYISAINTLGCIPNAAAVHKRVLPATK